MLALLFLNEESLRPAFFLVPQKVRVHLTKPFMPFNVIVDTLHAINTKLLIKESVLLREDVETLSYFISVVIRLHDIIKGYRELDIVHYLGLLCLTCFLISRFPSKLSP